MMIERTVNGQTFQLRPAWAGRYEGGLLLNQVVDDSRWSDDILGLEEETPGCFMKILGPFSEEELTVITDLKTGFALTSDEQAFLQAIAGAIVQSDSLGFITVTWFDTPSELEVAWQGLEDQFYPHDDEL